MSASDFDEVDQEWDVFVGTELTPFLHLCPLPSASLAARFNQPLPAGKLLDGRFKPTAKKLELTLPFVADDFRFLSEERAKELQLNGGMKVSGSAWPWRPVQYLAGQFKGDDLFLTPVESTISISAALNQLDELDARVKAASAAHLRHRSASDESVTTATTATTTNTTATTPGRTIQMQFRRKETEEQVQARLNSYAYLQRQVEDESWLPIKHYAAGADELAAVRERLFTEVREDLEFAGEGDEVESYLDLVVGQVEAANLAETAVEAQ